ncbi:MAG: pyruvate dehydrogenase complex dihydrolipoamide acetyltransferase [Alphaproteobacteria bacterium]|nr:pyruvate dehydrogenase complex dihydrolipoamide acetyltransferase [Alphaproteobacteria bacterium]
MASNILMPALSPTMEEGKLAKWLVKEGDEVRSGDILAEIETDKATMEFEAVDEGRIGKILVPEGSEGIKVNTPIATLLGEGEEASADAVPDISAAMASIKDAVSAEAPPPEPVAPKPRPAPKTAAPATAVAPSTEHRLFASPLARRIAAQSGIDLAALSGSGPRGRIVKADVEAAAKSGVSARPAAKAPAPAGTGLPGVVPLPDARLFFKPEDVSEIPHDSMRKSIARRLTSAMTLIPHFYLTIDCNIDNLMAVRTRLNAAAPKENGYKLSVNDFIVKASALSLMRVPAVNASWTDDAILRHKHADIGVAVALDFGLITPIVFAAEEKGLAAISGEVKDLAGKARAKQLKPAQFEGGSFAISNLGMFGIKEFTAVINPPHAAILAVGAGEERAIVRNGKLETATMMTVTMSCDHRVIDGATGAQFLQVFKTYIEDPAAMLL